ncbi:MAG: hypothetical protein WAN03_02035 [Candidatus Sulfotelmatobacter sp.]
MSGLAAIHTAGDSNGHVINVMRQAELELRQLIVERAQVTKRIGTVKRTILGLAKLYGDDILDAVGLNIDRKPGSRQPGITRACRKVLMEAQRPMTAREVCDEIQRTAPSLLAHHKDPRTTIFTILGRLAMYGEATVLAEDRGRRSWMWAAEQNGGSGQVSDEGNQLNA